MSFVSCRITLDCVGEPMRHGRVATRLSPAAVYDRKLLLDAAAPRAHASSAANRVGARKLNANSPADREAGELSPQVERNPARRSGRRGTQRSGIKEELSVIDRRGGQPRS